MPQDVLKVGDILLFESDSSRATRQFSTVVQVYYNGTKHFGTTMGPSKFANSGLFFVHDGQLKERNYEFVQVKLLQVQRPSLVLAAWIGHRGKILPRTELSELEPDFFSDTVCGSCCEEQFVLGSDESRILHSNKCFIHR